jgi:hypothetical protein
MTGKVDNPHHVEFIEASLGARGPLVVSGLGGSFRLDGVVALGGIAVLRFVPGGGARPCRASIFMRCVYRRVGSA